MASSNLERPSNGDLNQVPSRSGLKKHTRYSRYNFNMTYLSTLSTPLGDASYAWEEGDTLIAFGFGSIDNLSIPQNIIEQGDLVSQFEPNSKVEVALDRYFNHDRTALDAVELRIIGPPFFTRVWAALRKVGFGQVVSYKELAALSGNPRAVRAAASACATNPIAVVIPCHRVTYSDGEIGNYFYGTELKAALLAHESRPLSPLTDHAVAGAPRGTGRYSHFAPS